MPGKLQLSLFLASLCVSLAMGEMAVRLFASRRAQSTVAISSPHFVLDAHGAVRHIPNETVRMVSILEDSLEFDVIYHTNRHGLVDHRDYPAARGSGRRYAFAGDSFTYGMGAEAWVPQLRDRAREAGADVDIYNLGVNGASVQHFRALLSSVASELPVTDIVVIPITNDFYRPWWVPVHAPEGTRMCWDPPQCTMVRALYPIVDYDAPADALVAQYQRMRAARVAAQPAEPVWKRILWRSELYLLARRRALQAFRAPERDPYDLEDPSRLDVNLAALAGIRKDFPALPITLALFPQLNEVEQGAYHLDLAQAASHLEMDYFPALTRCSWSTDMYHRANLHPNARGYRNFADCLWRHLRPDN